MEFVVDASIEQHKTFLETPSKMVGNQLRYDNFDDYDDYDDYDVDFHKQEEQISLSY
jgi:hypothetical protein